ncbi:MAG: hypothetical protein F6J93_25370 [Oscillatoria sp. SIO1A7]|nr:hypothetical protein [Oscillatoria sp. SIO1A7]
MVIFVLKNSRAIAFAIAEQWKDKGLSVLSNNSQCTGIAVSLCALQAIW